MTKGTIILVVLGLLWPMGVRADAPPADLDADCRVGFADLWAFAEDWLTGSDPNTDFNGNGHVDGADLAIFASYWRHWDCPIVINEILAHSHADAPDWIELHNASSVPVDIGRWWLSDARNEPDKFVIPAGTIVEPFGYVVFYENTHFGNPFNPDTRTPFAFSENGEVLYVCSGDDPVFPDCRIEEQFGASETAYSFGRYRKSTGTYDFVTMSELTPGRANAYPRIGPIVINEIMYHPSDNGDAEYVELLNVSGGPITLYDFMAMEPWRFRDESGIDFWFPADEPVTLDGNEHLLLVKDVDEMSDYGIGSGVKILEWGSGKLANQGERLELLKPGDVDEVGTRYWIAVDRVNYSDGSRRDEFPDGIDRWPAAADGLGPSLNRLFPRRYGDDPNNWQATIPTPGSTND